MRAFSRSVTVHSNVERGSGQPPNRDVPRLFPSSLIGKGVRAHLCCAKQNQADEREIGGLSGARRAPSPSHRAGAMLRHHACPTALREVTGKQAVWASPTRWPGGWTQSTCRTSRVLGPWPGCEGLGVARGWSGLQCWVSACPDPGLIESQGRLPRCADRSLPQLWLSSALAPETARGATGPPPGKTGTSCERPGKWPQ